MQPIQHAYKFEFDELTGKKIHELLGFLDADSGIHTLHVKLKESDLWHHIGLLVGAGFWDKYTIEEEQEFLEEFQEECTDLIKQWDLQNAEVISAACSGSDDHCDPNLSEIRLKFSKGTLILRYSVPTDYDSRTILEFRKN